MDAVAMESRNSSQYTSAGSSDDSNYVSYQDNEITMDSDDDYVAHQKTKNQKACAKRLQSFRGGKVFRNASTSSEHIERQPTRRPNPKIFNRNALMARENRKKKKQHLETLERSVDNLKDENKTLRLKLKKRSTMVHKLRDEGLYLKSIIANKTSIMTLLRTIQGNKLPITSSNMSFMTDLVEQSSGNDRQHYSNLNSPAATIHSCSSPSSSLLSSCDDEQKENGTVLFNEDPFLSSSLMANQLFSFTDLDHLGFSNNHSSFDDEMKLENWESLLNDDTPFQPKCTDDNVELSSTVSSEHNYSNNNFIEQTNADEPGICLHLSSGRVSLEFCASCHRNSQNAWIEEL